MAGSDYRERPAPPGFGFGCLWTQTVGPGPYVQRIVPDACVDLVWSAGTGAIEVAGPDTGPVLAELEPGERVVGLRFRPGLAAPALGLPTEAFRDGRVPLREVWGDEAEALAEAMAASEAPAAELARAAAVRIRTAKPADPAVPALVEGLAERSVRDMAVRLGLSERQLHRRSLAAFGYGPKTLQRVLRFQRALRLARAGAGLADVAYDSGYADQPHLAHEVRDLAGVPIRDLL